MGKKNYLIEGVSGAGKTAVAIELSRRGYQAIHGDRELRYRGDPETGEPIPQEQYEHTPTWMSEHQLWDLGKVRTYIDNKDESVTFFCGGSRNFKKFVDLIDNVFILDVDKDTMINRIDERVAKDPAEFGAKLEEKELILQLHESREDIPKVGIVIDSTQPLNDVIEEILSHCSNL